MNQNNMVLVTQTKRKEGSAPAIRVYEITDETLPETVLTAVEDSLIELGFIPQSDAIENIMRHVAKIMNDWDTSEEKTHFIPLNITDSWVQVALRAPWPVEIMNPPLS
jgi:hypothetical protein